MPKRLISPYINEGALRRFSVRAGKAIPKSRMDEAMRGVKKIRLKRGVHVGDVVADNFLGLGVNLIATREIIR
ncbi:MAG: hypothetical protein DRP85_02560 [Candidatus Makaraimicrobium thalassicum]|nr:MAG: hypothetical protein DRP85_02560 [Candidatus Omnitrophota bacterium]